MRMLSFVGTTFAMALSPALAAAQDHVIQIGHDNSPDIYNNPSQACAQVFQNIVKTETNGAIGVEIFPNSQIGTITEQVQQVRNNVIQATIASTGAMASYYPKIDVLNLPFAFASNASTYEVYDGEFGQALASDMEEELGDVKVLGFPDTGGFFAVTNSAHPIETLEDFKGVRVRTMTLPSHQAIMDSLGAESYPLAFGELYSALQTGVIDGQMNPVPIISYSKFEEVQQYMTLTNHLFSPYTFLMNLETWENLSEDQQKVVMEASQSCVTASRGLSRMIEASERGVSGLSETMEITSLTPEQRQSMRDATLPAFEAHIEGTLGEEGVALLDILKENAAEANDETYMTSSSSSQ